MHSMQCMLDGDYCNHLRHLILQFSARQYLRFRLLPHHQVNQREHLLIRLPLPGLHAQVH